MLCALVKENTEVPSSKSSHVCFLSHACRDVQYTDSLADSEFQGQVLYHVKGH